jgi:nucleotide-binding universal stress UspA family protein
METIVVGIDGSDAANRALEWATLEARLRDARLRIVHAWLEIFVEGYFAAPAMYERDAVERAARAVLDKATASVRSESPDVDVDPALVHGQAATVLLEEADTATMVVVGSRGRGGFAELVMGSVSHRVVHHAKCPVVVVH